MAVEAVVSVVIQKVTDLLNQESTIFDKVVDQVEDIRIELRKMRGFLTDAEGRQKSDVEAKKWVQEYLETLYNVEDMVETYVLKLVRKQTKMCLFQNYGFHFHDLKELKAYKKLRRKMKQIEEKIEKLNERKPNDIKESLRSTSLGQDSKKRNTFDEQNSENPSDLSFGTSKLSQKKQMLSISYKEEGSDFISFKDEEKRLEERLTSESGKIVGVFGPIGSGKTTLVKRIYNRKSVSEKFEYHAWLDVSEEKNFKDLLLRVWNQVNENGDKELTVPDVKQLKKKLSSFLKGKKYLIVLDDARKQPDAWSKLIDALPEKNDSKVVLITSKKEIAESWDSVFLNLRLLDDDESWELCLTKSHQEKDRSPSSGLSSQRNQILKICKGLPLNIVLLGGFLSTKRMSYEECSQLFNNDNLGGLNTEIWELSYTDLPAHYKLCLLYLTLFPKEFDLSVRRIIRLWLAEGFLQCPPGLGLDEDLAEECFNDLVKRNLVKVSKLRSDGGHRKCHLPGFLRDRLLPIAQDISLFHIHQMSAEQGRQSLPNTNPFGTSKKSTLPKPGVRRIVEYANIQDSDPNDNFQNLRSYLSFNFQRYDTPAKGVGNFLRKIIGTKGFGLLRVLDLEGVYKPILPTTLKHLLQLRYLGLRWTFLDSLPKSVGDLPYLETLDLKRTYINTLPSSVWKLKRLRHLYLPQVRLDTSLQQPSSQLLTLWGLIIDDDSNMKNGLNILYDLRELGITCQLKEFDELMSWIKRLTHLQSLNLTSKNEMGCPSNLHLENLSELEKLSHLEMLGMLRLPLKKDQFPPYLRVLTLSVSHLEIDPMEILSQLQCLSVLRLLAKSYCGKKMKCPENGFTSLRVLKLWMLDELEEWVVQQGSMPCIKELNIRRCEKLKEIPLMLMQRTTLEKLIVTSMPKEFQKYVRDNISEYTLLKINEYEFTRLPWDKDPDLWK